MSMHLDLNSTYQEDCSNQFRDLSIQNSNSNQEIQEISEMSKYLTRQEAEKFVTKDYLEEWGQKFGQKLCEKLSSKFVTRKQLHEQLGQMKEQMKEQIKEYLNQQLGQMKGYIQRSLEKQENIESDEINEKHLSPKIFQVRARSSQQKKKIAMHCQRIELKSQFKNEINQYKQIWKNTKDLAHIALSVTSNILFSSLQFSQVINILITYQIQFGVINCLKTQKCIVIKSCLLIIDQSSSVLRLKSQLKNLKMQNEKSFDLNLNTLINYPQKLLKYDFKVWIQYFRKSLIPQIELKNEKRRQYVFIAIVLFYVQFGIQRKQHEREFASILLCWAQEDSNLRMIQKSFRKRYGEQLFGQIQRQSIRLSKYVDQFSSNSIEIGKGYV